MAILKRANGDTIGQVIELKAELTLIGRSPECQIILDPNGVSRRHAQIRKVGESHVLADLGSRNKTLVNNAEVKAGSQHALKPGDRINICDVEFIYYLLPPRDSQSKDADEMVVTEGEGADDPNMHTLDASRSSAMASVVRPEVKLKAILEITRNLSSELRIDAVAPKILDSLMELFPQAERLFLVLLDPETKRLIRKAFRYRPRGRTPFSGAVPEDEVPMSISRSLVNHVLGQKKAVLSQDAGNDKNLPTSASIADLKIRSVMCAPLLTPDNQALGILQLDTSDRRQFSQDDLDVLAAVAGQAAVAVQNASMHESLLARERVDRDLKLAEQVQKRFLPQSVPKVEGYEFFAHYHPAYEVGGDYYDFVPLANSRVAVALGDVSGKGVAAALMMAKFSGDTRYCVLTKGEPAAAATALNGLLCDAAIEEKFITLSLSVLDAPNRTLTYASAGHMPLMIRRADGRVEEVEESITGFPLGIMPNSTYDQAQVSLEPGDVVVVYSDGVPDSRSPREELYDSRDNRRLLNRLTELRGGPSAVGRAILQDIREFSAGHSQADDITLICFGPLGPEADDDHDHELNGTPRALMPPFKVSNVRLELGEPESLLPEKLSGRLGVAPTSIARWRILRKSLDARRHDDLHFVFTAEVEIPDATASLASHGVEPFEPERFDWPEPGASPLSQRPLIIGAGPAGLFAGYFLALQGYRPLLLERGRAVKERVADVRAFDGGGLFDPESNYLFGEGGAGTFSDGKLTSRTTGPDVRRVLEVLADCHGKPSILYEQRPHLGSNRLPLVVRTLRRKLEELGGEVKFSCRVEDLDIDDGRLRGVETSSGRFEADLAVLAVGHSARDTYGMLLRRGVPLEAKPFQLGVRIEQPQGGIDDARFGRYAGHPDLGAAEYQLTTRTGRHDLFTFCMCPGGTVMASVSEPGYFGTNGMSESRRDTPFANSGLVITVDPSDLGSRHPLAGVHLQQKTERLAYLAGGRTYRAPIQWAHDFLKGRTSRGKLPTSYERGAVPVNLDLILPPFVLEALGRGLPILDRKLRGAFLRDATLTGPESRGSSPVRITRAEETRESPAVAGLYPCGEGAGYAGGIISAAVDGLRTARAIVARYAPAR